MSDEIGLETARKFLPVDIHPNSKKKRRGVAARQSAHPAWTALGRVQLQGLTVWPRQCAGIGAGVRNDLAEDRAKCASLQSELNVQNGKRLPWVRSIVLEARAPHATWLVFSSDAHDERIPTGLLGGVKNSDRTCSRNDNLAIGEADPLALVLAKQLIARGPIVGFVFTPFRIDLPRNVGRQLIGNTFH